MGTQEFVKKKLVRVASIDAAEADWRAIRRFQPEKRSQLLLNEFMFGPLSAAFGVKIILAACLMCLTMLGVCPGNEESAGESHSTRSPKGNRPMRRLLNQAAQSAVKVKGSIFELTFQRLLPRLGYLQAIWAIAHRLCRLLWLILHKGVRYEERGPAVSAKSKRAHGADDWRTPKARLPRGRWTASSSHSA